LLTWAISQRPADYLAAKADLEQALVNHSIAIEQFKERLKAFEAELLQPPVISWLVDTVYQVGDGRPHELTDDEHAILQAFLCRPAMNEKTLCRETKNDDARRTLMRMLKKYDGVFAAAILRPRAKSSGGYSATVRVVENR
jgi:hypothetical protein